MRRHQGPCIEARTTGLTDYVGKPIKEAFSISIVAKDIPAFDSS
jgi:hypothetical protein